MFYLYPTYSEIFKESPPSVKSLLDSVKIPASILLKIAMYINAQLSDNTVNNEELDKDLIKTLLKRIPFEEKKRLQNFIDKSNNRGNKVIIFNRVCIIELIHQLLIHYDHYSIDRDSTPEEEFVFYKIILVSNELRTRDDDINIKECFSRARYTDDFFFQRMN